MELRDKPVSMADDADLLLPQETAARLAALTRDGSVTADYYGNGGAVAAFEERVAAHLGKEAAVLFPTGTLANLIAMRLLAGTAGARLVVHAQSHFFNDMGDNLALLGGFTMVPLAGEGAGFTAAELQAEIARARDARVAALIGAVDLESPSRRVQGRRFGAERLHAVTALARKEGLPLFLDGARMLIECAWSGQTPAEMAAPFDLVYLSLYKYLDAPFGCILAGPAALLHDLYHERRRFGGSLWEMWPAAVLAGAALDRQAGQWTEARGAAQAVFDRLAVRGISASPFADGTNTVPLVLPDGTDPAALVAAGKARGLKLPAAAGGRLPAKINASWLRRDPVALADQLADAVAAARTGAAPAP